MLQAAFQWMCAHATTQQKAAGEDPAAAPGVRRVA
jgi:hypothetical protein